MLSKIYDREDAETDTDVNRFGHTIEIMEKAIVAIEVKAEAESAPYTAETYGISYSEFYYLIQDLCNKGLLTDVGIADGAAPFTLFEINQLGIDVIESIT